MVTAPVHQLASDNVSVVHPDVLSPQTRECAVFRCSPPSDAVFCRARPLSLTLWSSPEMLDGVATIETNS